MALYDLDAEASKALAEALAEPDYQFHYAQWGSRWAEFYAVHKLIELGASKDDARSAVRRAQEV